MKGFNGEKNIFNNLNYGVLFVPVRNRGYATGMLALLQFYDIFNYSSHT